MLHSASEQGQGLLETIILVLIFGAILFWVYKKFFAPHFTCPNIACTDGF